MPLLTLSGDGLHDVAEEGFVEDVVHVEHICDLLLDAAVDEDRLAQVRRRRQTGWCNGLRVDVDRLAQVRRRRLPDVRRRRRGYRQRTDGRVAGGRRGSVNQGAEIIAGGAAAAVFSLAKAYSLCEAMVLAIPKPRPQTVGESSLERCLQAVQQLRLDALRPQDRLIHAPTACQQRYILQYHLQHLQLLLCNHVHLSQQQLVHMS